MRRKLFSNILILAATTLMSAAVSCQQDDTLQYNNVTMGNVVDGTFISDQGNIFNIVEQSFEFRLDTMKRALVVCDVLCRTEGTENEYDVRLKDASPVLTKDLLASGSITEEDALVKDPVHIKEIWYSGGYLNMYITFPIKQGSQSPHLINLVTDDSKTSGSSYSLELRHNGFGEIWSEKNDDLILAGAYVSFSLGKAISGDSAHVTLNWRWHKPVGNGWSLEVVDNKIEFDWKRESFEQAPLSLASKSVSDIM